MKYLSTVLILTFLMPCGDARGQTSTSPNPTVTIDGGILAGTRFGHEANEIAFYGIPFAAPPIGNLRWRPPERVAPWQGIRPARNFAPACPQGPSTWWSEMAGIEKLETSEDCLYLNIWTTNLSGTHKQSVMMWIHGGGNVEGSSYVPQMGPALARKGVVVVSVDYRLGVLGYLAHPALTAESPYHSSGNYGLLDQIAALEWIKRNIATFGGDPTAVTIFGESSGGEDICHLLASPLSRGLIHRAILESGVCLDSLYSHLNKPQSYFGNHGSGENLGVRLTTALGIPNHPDILSKLRTVPVERLLETSRNLESADFGVIIDGWVVPAQPVLTFAEGKHAHVPVLIGSNADETTVFGKSAPLATDNSRPKNILEYRKWLMKEFREFADEVWKEYPVNSDAEAEKVFVRMQTDYDFGFGSYRFARTAMKYGQPAYIYYFSYVGRGPFRVLGAFHSEEMMFVGETYWKSWHPNANDKRLADMMEDYWTQFAKSGNPNGSGLRRWPVYDEKSEQCLKFGKQANSGTIPHRSGYRLFERILQSRLAEIH